MLTITYKGKTYEPAKYENNTIGKELQRMIDIGYLEEVKENKEQYTIRDIGHGYVAFDRDKKDPSILEKLREELEKRKNTMKVDNDEVESIYEELLAFLTSLETKEEPVPPTDKGREQYIADHPDELSQLQTFASPDKFKAMREQPQFTPGQMIEVSNDGEKWGDRPLEFKGMNKHGQYETWDYFEGKNNRMFFSFWNHARPLSQEDIELPGVPDWKAFTNDGRTYDSKDYQIEQLTKFCQAIAPIVNQLIKANKK